MIQKLKLIYNRLIKKENFFGGWFLLYVFIVICLVYSMGYTVYLGKLAPEELYNLLESWQKFFTTIFFYFLAGISGLAILWLVVTLILLCLELLGITVASIGGLVKGFVTEFLYWIDRLKKLLKNLWRRHL